jgi:hypothetical protein
VLGTVRRRLAVAGVAIGLLAPVVFTLLDPAARARLELRVFHDRCVRALHSEDTAERERAQALVRAAGYREYDGPDEEIRLAWYYGVITYSPETKPRICFGLTYPVTSAVTSAATGP